MVSRWRYCAGVDETLEDWFCREILPYEAALMRYLAKKGSALNLDAQDLRNEVYVRILESADHVKSAGARAFLFSTARNLLVDLARRSRVVSIEFVEDLEASNVLLRIQ